MSLYCILKFKENMREISMWNILRDPIGKGGGNIHIEIAPLFLLNSLKVISSGMICVGIWGKWMARPLGNINKFLQRQS